MTSGVLPVPPRVRYPILTTGTGNLWLLRKRFFRYRKARRVMMKL
jgi:hypothetical protein